MLCFHFLPSPFFLSSGAEKSDTKVCSGHSVCQLKQCNQPYYRCLQCKYIIQIAHFMHTFRKNLIKLSCVHMSHIKALSFLTELSCSGLSSKHISSFDSALSLCLLYIFKTKLPDGIPLQEHSCCCSFWQSLSSEVILENSKLPDGVTIAYTARCKNGVVSEGENGRKCSNISIGDEVRNRKVFHRRAVPPIQ